MTTSAPVFIASDVDGTLLNTTDSVPADNRSAIRDAVDAGAVFVIATGRPPRWVSPVADELGFAPVAVCANGAVTVDSGTGEILESRMLAPDTMRLIDDVLRTCLPTAAIAAERFFGDAAEHQFVATPHFEHAWLAPDHLEIGHDEVLSDPAFKLMARDPAMTSTAMRAAIGTALDGVADVTFSIDTGLLEFSAPGVSKASGLQAVWERLGLRVPVGAAARGVPGAEASVPATVAFGDMPNDLEMLAWADLGVAMGNALEEVRGSADVVTLDNDSAGVAHILRRWF